MARTKSERWVAAYLEDLAARGRRPKTIETYAIDLRLALAACGGQLTTARVRAYLASAPCPQQRLTRLRGFARWLVARGHHADDVTAGLELASAPTRLPRGVMRAGEVERVLAAVPLGTGVGVRDRALLEVLYTSALRSAEVRGLALVDVDRAGGTLWVRAGKGGADRVVPVGPRALGWLDRYLTEVRPRWGPASVAVFVARTGEPMSRDLLYQRCTTAVRRAGIDKPGHPHAWRHAAATALLEGGADIRHIQALLGHESVRTTTRYARVSVAALRAVHRRTHPFEGG